jgi:hypothetical protein
MEKRNLKLSVSSMGRARGRGRLPQLAALAARSSVRSIQGPRLPFRDFTLMRNSRIEEDLIERAAVSSAAQEPDNDPGRNPTQSFGEKRWGENERTFFCRHAVHSHVLKIPPSLGSFATHPRVFGLRSVGGAERIKKRGHNALVLQSSLNFYLPALARSGFAHALALDGAIVAARLLILLQGAIGAAHGAACPCGRRRVGF